MAKPESRQRPQSGLTNATMESTVREFKQQEYIEMPIPGTPKKPTIKQPKVIETL